MSRMRSRMGRTVSRINRFRLWTRNINSFILLRSSSGAFVLNPVSLEASYSTLTSTLVLSEGSLVAISKVTELELQHTYKRRCDP